MKKTVSKPLVASIILLCIMLTIFGVFQFGKLRPTWMEDYQEIINDGNSKDYILHDIDANGIPELLYDGFLYYYDQNRVLQSLADVHYGYLDSSDLPTITHNGIMCLEGGTDFRTIRVYTMKDDAVETEIIMVGFMDENRIFSWYKINDNNRIAITTEEREAILSQYGTTKIKPISVDVPIKEIAETEVLKNLF